MTEQNEAAAEGTAAPETIAEKVEQMIEEAAAAAVPDLSAELKIKVAALAASLIEAHEQDKGRTTSAPCPSCKRDVEAQNRLGSRVSELVQELTELAK
jgi:hypothetical protein